MSVSVATRGVGSVPSAQGSTASATYASDAWTLLFDDFEGATLADSRSPGATFDGGFRTGQGLHLTDTAAYALYRETAWVSAAGGPNSEMKLDSGTIEFFYKPDTDGAAPTAFLASNNLKQTFGAGDFSIAVVGSVSLEWILSTGAAPADEVRVEWEPPLNPGQWYHIAATWDTATGMKLFVNGTQRRSDPTPTVIDSGTFYLGSPFVPTGEGVRGTIDRFRLSARARSETEFPAALTVTIDTPIPPPLPGAPGETLTQPFFVAYRSEASDSPAVTVSLLITQDTLGLTGTTVASNLAGSDTVTLSGLPAGRYRIVAVATTGSETAFAEKGFFRIEPFPNPLSLGGGAGACLLSRTGAEWDFLRGMRDVFLGTPFGRFLAGAYYRAN